METKNGNSKYCSDYLRNTQREKYQSCKESENTEQKREVKKAGCFIHISRVNTLPWFTSPPGITFLGICALHTFTYPWNGVNVVYLLQIATTAKYLPQQRLIKTSRTFPPIDRKHIIYSVFYNKISVFFSQ